MNCWKNRFRLMVTLALMVVFSGSVIGCESGQKKKDKKAMAPPKLELRVTHHLGGTHYRTIIHDGVWYQTFGNQLLIMDPRTARPVNEIELCEFGKCGPALDMAITSDGDMYIVLERDAVLTLSLDDPSKPVVVARRSYEQLGFEPLSLSVVNESGIERVYVCGDGGAAPADGGPAVMTGQGIVQSVAKGATGLVATIDRRVYEVKTGAYIGSASVLLPLPNDEKGAMVFIRRTDEAAQIGIMESDIRERQARTATTGVMGHVSRVRCLKNIIWIIAPDRILSYAINGDNLELRDSIKVRGALDVDMISENYLAVAGSFGRAIYRIKDDDKGKGDTFIMAQREPSHLTHAISDRLQVLAGTPEEGTWLYQVGSEATLMDKALTQRPPSTREAEITEGRALISNDSVAVLMTVEGINLRWAHPRGWLLRSMVAVEGRLFVGHDQGLVVLELKKPTAEELKTAEKNKLRTPEPKIVMKGELRLDGPVLYVFALLTGRGATYVAEFGGFGMAELIPEEPVVVVAEE